MFWVYLILWAAAIPLSSLWLSFLGTSLFAWIPTTLVSIYSLYRINDTSGAESLGYAMLLFFGFIATIIGYASFIVLYYWG